MRRMTGFQKLRRDTVVKKNAQITIEQKKQIQFSR